MRIMETGRYRLTEDVTIMPNSISITTLPKGTEIEITQVDVEFHKIIGPQLGDWQFWVLPVEKIA
jgi:hypothetical protein